MSGIISTYDIAHKHGQEMYILGLKHALSIVEILGDKAADKLKSDIEQAKKELNDENA